MPDRLGEFFDLELHKDHVNGLSVIDDVLADIKNYPGTNPVAWLQKQDLVWIDCWEHDRELTDRLVKKVTDLSDKLGVGPVWLILADKDATQYNTSRTALNLRISGGI